MCPGDKASATAFSHGIVMKLATVAGNIMIEEAKMGGMTPEVLIFNGKCVLWPPYMRLPTTRLAYCTGILR